MNAKLEKKTVLQVAKTFTRESIDVFISISHHKHMLTPKMADKTAQTWQVGLGILVHFNSTTSTYEIQQYRDGGTKETKGNIKSIAPTSFETEVELFAAIKTHLDVLELDIKNLLFSVDGNLGREGEGFVSERFKLLVSIFAPRPHHLMIFSKTDLCLKNARELYDCATVVESDKLGASIKVLFGEPNPSLKNAPALKGSSQASSNAKSASSMLTNGTRLPVMQLAALEQSSLLAASLFSIPTPAAASTSSSLGSSLADSSLGASSSASFESLPPERPVATSEDGATHTLRKRSTLFPTLEPVNSALQRSESDNSSKSSEFR